MEQRRRDVQQHHGEEGEGEIIMRAPQQGVQSVALGQYSRQAYPAIQLDRICRGREHGPAQQRHHEHERVERIM